MRKIYTFIGMSGVGKSYWAKKFQKAGYDIFSIDDLISGRLADLINNEDGDKSVSYEKTAVGDLAKWMGFPGDKRYKTNANKYLKLESKITLESLKEASKNNKNTIIDTTGSIIYTDKKLQSLLKKHTQIIFLDTTEKNLKTMFEIFCKVPKPIIWGEIYKAKKGEDEAETLKRCYKSLLTFRINNYKKLAHKVLDYNFTHKKDLPLEKFIQKISY